MSTTKIEWTATVNADGSVTPGKTWNPTRGCSRISQGCKNCYAERIAARFSDPVQPFHLYAERKPKAHWTGKVGLIEEKLLEPLSWRKPCRCFVNSMSDLFHEDLPDEDRDKVFAVMALTPHVTHQVLTKRGNVLERYFASCHAHGLTRFDDVRKWMHLFSSKVKPEVDWPLPNVWLGVSVENKEQRKRIDHLRRTPAIVRFLSCEPLLEDLGTLDLTGIHWVIAGAESGPSARPCKEEWVRSLKDQCVAAGVPFFYKQTAVAGKKRPTPDMDGKKWMQFPEVKR